MKRRDRHRDRGRDRSSEANSLGLIEASGLALHLAGSFSSSEANSLGLIEALDRASNSPRASALPRQTASASLKPGRHCRQGDDARDSSEANSLGLIEALRSDAGVRGDVPLPRQTASASLKPAPSRGQPCRRDALPRQTASASLKQLDAAAPNRMDIASSEANSLGLIEARFVSLGRLACCFLFRGKQPRPH